VNLEERLLDRWSGAKFHAINPGVKANKTAALGVAADRVRVAERGRDPERYAPRSDAELGALRTELGLEPDDRLVLCVARHEPPKGLDRLVGMVDELVERDARVVVAIAGREGVSTPGLRNQAQGLRHPDRLRFLGHRDDVPSLLQLASVSVCPSYREGGAMAVVEAWASGTPVAVVPIEGLKGVFVDDQNAVVRPAETLAAAIGDLLEDPDRAARLAASARADFDARFTVERSAEQLLQVYDWAASGR
ncbi:MAG: glycosyltransferase family 4 protein, partial [Actinomycetes bacterium]